MPIAVFGQQFPFKEGYYSNPFNLSPAYAGIQSNKILFVDYQSDWSGMEGGPTTCQLSYNDKYSEKKELGGDFIYDQSDIFKKNIGLGARFIYDKTDIFKQTLLLGTYTYEVRIAKEHKVNFGLSAGFYQSSIDLEKYLNDPRYLQDNVVLYGTTKSRIRFATDISALYRYKQAEAGILFSNIMFGTARYRNTNLVYKPLKNYLLHGSYLLEINSKWSVKPTLIINGGQNIHVQMELSSTIAWNNRFWGTTLFRTGGIFGLGIGGEIYDGIILNYSYNVISNISLYSFGSNQLSLGVKLSNFIKNKHIEYR
jgi:type IX secretion system PorP/SprF family membrane protein